ncbi:hypothetical protein MIR68_003034 [Amoeboaphelidium protococcarum]|nr:hypothetical protein MIR68_003034 [Amoeboaphelidium protococcarum]
MLIQYPIDKDSQPQQHYVRIKRKRDDQAVDFLRIENQQQRLVLKRKRDQSQSDEFVSLENPSQYDSKDSTPEAQGSLDSQNAKRLRLAKDSRNEFYLTAQQQMDSAHTREDHSLKGFYEKFTPLLKDALPDVDIDEEEYVYDQYRVCAEDSAMNSVINDSVNVASAVLADEEDFLILQEMLEREFESDQWNQDEYGEDEDSNAEDHWAHEYPDIGDPLIELDEFASEDFDDGSTTTSSQLSRFSPHDSDSSDYEIYGY